MCYHTHEAGIRHTRPNEVKGMKQPMKEPARRGASGRPNVDQARRAHVGRVIRRYRLAAGMDQAALAAALGYTKTAVGNWELGLSRPDIDHLPALCALLSIPVAELLGMEGEPALSPDDRELLALYRRLDEFDRRTVRQLMERLVFRQDHQEKDRLRRAYRRLWLFEEAASAGVGLPMQDRAEDRPVFALADRVPPGTDGVIHVNGRSMEPRFPDGSYVYVARSAPVLPGQVGIFIINGESYIKEYQPDGLHSLNPRYRTIRPGEGDSVLCFGRVTGAVGEQDLASGPLLEKARAAFDETDGEVIV